MSDAWTMGWAILIVCWMTLSGWWMIQWKEARDNCEASAAMVMGQ